MAQGQLSLKATTCILFTRLRPNFLKMNELHRNSSPILFSRMGKLEFVFFGASCLRYCSQKGTFVPLFDTERARGMWICSEIYAFPLMWWLPQFNFNCNTPDTHTHMWQPQSKIFSLISLWGSQACLHEHTYEYNILHNCAKDTGSTNQRDSIPYMNILYIYLNIYIHS